MNCLSSSGYMYFGTSSWWKQRSTFNHHQRKKGQNWTCFRHLYSAKGKGMEYTGSFKEMDRFHAAIDFERKPKRFDSWGFSQPALRKRPEELPCRERTHQITIPSGMTAYLFTLDIARNKPFKDHLRMETNDYIENRMLRNKRWNFVKPRLEEIVTSVTNSWNKITDSCVANALRAGYLNTNFDSMRLLLLEMRNQEWKFCRKLS